MGEGRGSHFIFLGYRKIVVSQYITAKETRMLQTEGKMVDPHVAMKIEFCKQLVKCSF